MSGTSTSMRKIGDLADASGVTVRTLHYYEEIGLLVPLERTAGWRRRIGFGPGSPDSSAPSELTAKRQLKFSMSWRT